MLFNFKPPEVDLSTVLPIIIVAVTGMIALILDMVRPNQKNDTIVSASLIGLVMAIAILIKQLGGVTTESFGDMITLDSLAVAGQLIIAVSAALVILFSEAYLRQKRVPFGEFYPLLLWSALGGMIMCCTRNLLTLFVGIELLSISLYVMAGMARGEQKSEESALKYFLLGAFATGFLLMGIAFLYGGSGSLNIDSIVFAFQRATGEDKVLLGLGSALLFAGLGFKASYAPFHQWTPDVYQGAPTNVAAFMSTGAKVGAFVALWRFFDMVSPIKEIIVPVAAVIAALTMTVGNLVALNQKDVKRIMAYSSIANAGYVLTAMVAHANKPALVGANTLVYFLISYTLMSVGTFAVIGLAAKDGKEITTVEGLRGLSTRSPFAAVALTVFVLSLIGIPPTPGFFGKLLIFGDALTGGYTWLAILVAVNSVISIGYYYSLISNAYTKEEGEEKPFELNPAFASTFTLCLAGIVAVVIFYGPLMGALNGVR